jgi:hypothetical protein
MSTKNDTSLTPTGTPTVNQTKRLSTIKTPGSPKTLKTGGGGGVKDVVSPGELCGFVCPSAFASRPCVHYHHILSGRSSEKELRGNAND